MPDNKRSQAITQGAQRAPNRAMLRAVGFTDGDFNKPIVGVANGYSTITPCNKGLNDLSLKAESALRRAGVSLAVSGYGGGGGGPSQVQRGRHLLRRRGIQLFSLRAPPAASTGRCPAVSH